MDWDARMVEWCGVLAMALVLGVWRLLVTTRWAAAGLARGAHRGADRMAGAVAGLAQAQGDLPLAAAAEGMRGAAVPPRVVFVVIVAPAAEGVRV